MRGKKAKEQRRQTEAEKTAARIAAAVADEFGAEGAEMSAIEREAYARWASRKRRARYPQNMPPAKKPGEVEVLYSKEREELRGLNMGEMVLDFLNSEAWKSTVGVKCAELDREADFRRAYKHAEIEAVLLYQRLSGVRSYKRAHRELCSYSEQHSRRTLGLTRPRDHVEGRRCFSPKNRSLDGVPSRATVSRHLTRRFPQDVRIALYQECLTRIVIEHAQRFPDFRRELLTLGWDGTIERSMYTPGFKRKRNGEYILDADGNKVPRLKTWELGSRTSAEVPASKRGHGALIVTGHTAERLPVAVRFDKLHANESKHVVDMLNTDIPRIREYSDRSMVGVSTLDGAFAKAAVRVAHRINGYLENTHLVSGGDSKETQAHLDERAGKVIPIDGHPNWRANGLREIFCMCGEGHTFARPSIGRHGEAIAATEGRCDTCGPIHITSGDWRLAKNPSHYVLVNPHDEADVTDIDWMFGHFLTRKDKRSAKYGNNRNSQGEGLHGSAKTRFKLFKDRARIRRVEDTADRTLAVYCLMHSLAMETRRARGDAEEPFLGWDGVAPDGGATATAEPPGQADAVAAVAAQAA